MVSKVSAPTTQSNQTTPSPASLNIGGEAPAIRWAIWAFSALVLLGLSILALNLTPNLRQVGYSADTSGELNIGQEMLHIADELQCPVCGGQSVAYSNSQLAGEMRRQITEKLMTGQDETAIKQYFIDRYGVRVLREPPRTGLNLWLWRLPIFGLVIGLAGLTWSLRHMALNRTVLHEEHAISTPSAEHEGDPLDPEIQELLTQYDRDLFRS